MKRKIVWVMVSCLMVLSLVMASCAPAAVEEEEKEVEEEEVVEEVEEEVVAPTDDTPKYGGMLKLGWDADINRFDDVPNLLSGCYTYMVTNEPLMAGDWARGPAGGYGTNETTWGGKLDPWHLYTGFLAESWEMPTKIEGDLSPLIFKIRQGVHWALNPDSEASRLVGGREMTVDDVIFSLERVTTDSRAYIYNSDPDLRNAPISSPAPWTVKAEFPWEAFQAGVSRFGAFVNIVPPEVVEKYDTLTDWKHSVGTGPFMLTDVVPGSTMTLMRNPNYWMKNPIGPGKGDQLPYPDGIKYLIIPDISTRYAALRTGKVDHVGHTSVAIDWEDAVMLEEQVPQLLSAKMPFVNARSFGIKIQEPPFDDVRVRQAMMLAIDWEGMNRALYNGEARYAIYPTNYVKGFDGLYLGLDAPDCPESVKELFSYNPEKARELLAEAGYPDGFKTSLVLGSTHKEIDECSIYVDYWSKINVDVALLPKETAAFSGIFSRREFDGLITSGGGTIGTTLNMINMRGPGRYNPSGVDDPMVNEAFPKIQSAMVTDVDEAYRMYRELAKHVIPQVYMIPRVSPDQRVLWWPWLKNYSGESAVGNGTRNWYNWPWLDLELKKSMGY